MFRMISNKYKNFNRNQYSKLLYFDFSHGSHTCCGDSAIGFMPLRLNHHIT